MPCTPISSLRMPSGGCSVISTSAISALVVGSQPGKSMPAALRAHRLAVGQANVDSTVVLPEARHLASAIDRHLQLADPFGQDAFDVGLPQAESVRMPGGEVADVEVDHLEA